MRPYFVRFGQRWQHFWVAGSGAPLLLLHDSPHRARTLAPLIESLSQSFLVIAPDLPGNGYSDPLPATATRASHFAAAAIALLDELRIGEFGVYGVGTGAVFAAEVGLQASQRVRGMVGDSYPIWSAAELDALGDRYLEPITPDAEGTHLAQLWSRVIDQNLYFPWHERSARNAIDRDLQDTAALHRQAMELLDAGDHHIPACRAALSTDGEARMRALSEAKLPALLLADEGSVVAGHLRRLPSLPNTTCVHTNGSSDRDRKVTAFFRALKIEPQAKGIYLPTTSRHYVQPRRYPCDADEWLYVDIPRHASTIWLHDLGQSHRRAPTSYVRVDLPGHGYSTLPWPDSMADVIGILTEAMDALGLEDAVMSGRGLGRLLAEAHAGTTAGAIPNLTMPDLTPDWAGAHLHRAWHYCRYRTQYASWAERTSSERSALTMPDPAVLHDQTIDLLRAGSATLSAIAAQQS